MTKRIENNEINNNRNVARIFLSILYTLLSSNLIKSRKWKELRANNIEFREPVTSGLHHFSRFCQFSSPIKPQERAKFNFLNTSLSEMEYKKVFAQVWRTAFTSSITHKRNHNLSALSNYYIRIMCASLQTRVVLVCQFLTHSQLISTAFLLSSGIKLLNGEGYSLSYTNLEEHRKIVNLYRG